MAVVTVARACLTVLLVAGGAARAVGAAADWFPVDAGDRWVYAHETRDENGGGRGRLDVHKWTTEETTIGSWSSPAGLVVERRVRVVDGTAPTGGWAKASRAFLIRGDCVYADVDWDRADRRLGEEFLKELDTFLSPDFCFPLAAHKMWGAPHGLPDWGVTRPEESKDWKVVGVRQRTFHVTSISSYPGAGVTRDVWFEKGVGVVRVQEVHHGTIGERRLRLLRFEPAARRTPPL
jgi:hypothetical protein